MKAAVCETQSATFHLCSGPGAHLECFLPASRMTLFTGLPGLLLMTLCLLSAQDAGSLEVLYPQRTIRPYGGSSAKLSCDAHYNLQKCGVVHVVWSKLTEETDIKLTNPEKYFTTVNETITSDHNRRRQVVTEILNVTPDDNGRYQCKADCETGETAMGHSIHIYVKDGSSD